MTTRNFINGAPLLLLSAGVASGDVTLTVASTTGYPNVPFTIALERATVNEEVCLATGKTGTTFTVVRGYDGTTPKAHSISSALEHATAALDYNEANIHINDVTRDDHTQYARKSLWTAKGQLLAATGVSAPSAVAVGADNTLLVASAAAVAGVAWSLVGTSSIADGAVTLAKLASSVQKQVTQSVSGYGSVVGPVAGQGVYDSSIDRFVGYVSTGWTFRPHGIGKITYSTGGPSGGIDGDVWLQYI
jgi:hypothetical protein